MTHAEAAIHQYNFWVQRFQFDVCSMIENETPKNTFVYRHAQLREEMIDALKHVAKYAYAGGEGEIAGVIQRAADDLKYADIQPRPM